MLQCSRLNNIKPAQLPKGDLLTAAAQHLGENAWHQRAVYLEQHRCVRACIGIQYVIVCMFSHHVFHLSALLDDDEEPLLLLAPHSVSLSLLVLLRAATMPDDAFNTLEGVHELIPAGECAQEDRWDASVDAEECMTPAMRSMLCTLCTQQLGRYPATFEASIVRWRQLGGGRTPGHGHLVDDDKLGAGKAHEDEDAVVERAALGLRIGEQQILHNIISILKPVEPVAKRLCT